MDDLYNMDVLNLAANIMHVGKLDTPQGSFRKVSKLCGSWVEVDINIKDGAVSQFAIRLQACALGQASASILSQHIIGASIADIQIARDALFDMLKTGGVLPKGRFKDLRLLSDVKNYPARHTSTLLSFDAALAAARIAAEK